MSKALEVHFLPEIRYGALLHHGHSACTRKVEQNNGLLSLSKEKYEVQ